MQALSSGLVNSTMGRVLVMAIPIDAFVLKLSPEGWGGGLGNGHL